MTDEKKVRGVYEAGSTRVVGDGFPMTTIVPSGKIPQVDPFLLLEYARPTRIEPGNATRGLENHPHRGFDAVTILYQGMLEHLDSAGNRGSIGPGDVQWLTAGSGLVHREKYDAEFSRQGGMLEMAQLWVNLPEAHKMSEPRYQTLLKEQIPVTTLGRAGYVRVIAGDMSGVEGPARTFSPVGVFDLHLNAGHDTELCLCDGHNAALVVLRGRVLVNGETEISGECVIALLEPEGSMLSLAAKEDSVLLLISGQPINEPVERQDAFIMNTREEVLQAVDDYQSGRMGRLS